MTSEPDTQSTQHAAATLVYAMGWTQETHQTCRQHTVFLPKTQPCHPPCFAQPRGKREVKTKHLRPPHARIEPHPVRYFFLHRPSTGEPRKTSTKPPTRQKTVGVPRTIQRPLSKVEPPAGLAAVDDRLLLPPLQAQKTGDRRQHQLIAWRHRTPRTEAKRRQSAEGKQDTTTTTTTHKTYNQRPSSTLTCDRRPSLTRRTPPACRALLHQPKPPSVSPRCAAMANGSHKEIRQGAGETSRGDRNTHMNQPPWKKGG